MIGVRLKYSTLQIIKLQNKTLRIINDVPLNESNHSSLYCFETSKNSYIVKLNSSLLFYDGFNAADKRVNWNLLLVMHDLTLFKVYPPIFCQYLLLEQTSGNFVQQYNYRKIYLE